MWETIWILTKAPIMAMSAMALITGVILWAMHCVRLQWRRNFREPFYQGILRPPGWGCIERKHDALFDLAAAATTLPLLWAFIAYVYARGNRPDVWGFLIVGVPTSLVMICVIKARLKSMRTARLGFLGECVVAENLAPLTSEGWRVFHDVPMSGEGGKAYNIDHVAVGPGGVVAVETKTISKSRKAIPRVNELRIEGEAVVLPSGKRKIYLKQARGQALSLRNFLRTENVRIEYVQPVVVLPGWIVSYPKGASPEIRDPRNVAAWMKKLEPILAPETVNAISTVLEKRCRNLCFDEADRKV
jgi:hypothetical protein